MVSFGWVREPEPASWLEGYTLPENPTLGPKLRGFEPVYPWDRPRPIPREAMISIKALHLTGPALRFFETPRSLQPARQVNAVVRTPEAVARVGSGGYHAVVGPAAVATRGEGLPPSAGREPGARGRRQCGAAGGLGQDRAVLDGGLRPGLLHVVRRAGIQEALE